MGKFFAKTLKFWGAVLCFGAAIGLFFVLKKFFSSGGGVISVKGILAPALFALLGLKLLIDYVKVTLKERNYLGLVVSILVVCMAGGCVYYFTSDKVKYAQLHEQVLNGEIDENEANRVIHKMLNSYDPQFVAMAIDCLKHYSAQGSSDADYTLARIYNRGEYGMDHDYQQAFIYLEKVRVAEELEEEKGPGFPSMRLGQLYSALGDIYHYGRVGERDPQLALDYYNRALGYPLLGFEKDGIIEEINLINANGE